MTLQANEIITSRRLSSQRRGSYGIDAPIGPAIMIFMIILYTVIAITSHRWRGFLPVALMSGFLGFYLHATLRGKFIVWSELLQQLNLRGDERILDLGCGRGAVLLIAAQHLTTGRAVGIDIWRTGDQSGNSIEATRSNALAEGVADCVELHTADMTALPFEDNSFDLVVSNMAIHNISGNDGRGKAISEAVRVVRPGGRLLIADVRCTRFYAKQLAALGMTGVNRRRLPWQCPAPLVTATKPERKQHSDKK